MRTKSPSIALFLPILILLALPVQAQETEQGAQNLSKLLSDPNNEHAIQSTPLNLPENVPWHRRKSHS